MKNVANKKYLKTSIHNVVSIFLLMNIMAIFHAYKFTHFTSKQVSRTDDPEKLNTIQKIKTLLFGVEYAKAINCPALLLYGAKDPKVSPGETKQIFTNMTGDKYLKIYKDAGHEDLLNDRTTWIKDIDLFLSKRATIN